MEANREMAITSVIFLLVTLFISSVSGVVYNTLYIQASPISAETPKVVLQQGTAGTSTIYIGSTSAKVSVAAPAPVPTYFPSGYSVPSGNWWNLNYGYRKKITVANNAEASLSSGYSVCLTENTASLISAGKMLSSGNDLRIVYWNATSSSWVELDRDVIDINTSLTKVWFKTQASIGASGSDANYYMYYGFSGTGTPPADKNDVYSFWNDFDSLDGWTHRKGSDGGVLGTVSVSTSVLTLTPGDSYTDFVIHNSFTTSDSEGFSVKTRARARYGAQTEDDLLTAVFFASIDGNGAVNNDYNSRDKPSQSRFCKLINGVFSTIVSGTGNVADTWYTYETFRKPTDEMKLLRDGSQVCPTSGWTSDSDLSSGYIGVGGEGANRNYDFDWILVRKYVDPEPSISVGSEEQDYHVSGTVPGSVQNVDSNYLVIRSAGSSTSSPVYNPSNYALVGSTTWVSGGISNLTSNDGVYMAFRSYAYYDYDYHYAESDSVSSTTQTTWQDKVTLTFTSVAGAYLVLASAELRGSSNSYDMEAQLTIDGTSYASLDTRPDETATGLYSHHFATFKAINLAAASHTFKIQYRSSSGFGTCSIQHARIAVFRIFDYASAENEGSQSVSGGYSDKVTKTFNVEVAGEYLVIASAELNPASTSYSVLARMGIDSAYQDEVSLEGEAVTTSWESYFTHDIKSFNAGSHTLSIQARSESGTHNIQRARIIAVRLTDYFLGWQSGKSDSYTTNGATSWADKLVVMFTPSTQSKYLILATAIVGGDASDGESYHSSFDFTLDGTEEGWWHGGISDDTDRITYATLKNSTLLEASPHSLKLRYHSEIYTSPDAEMGSARIIAIPMCGLKAVEVEFTGSSNTYTWTQLEWAIDSAWTIGSVSVTLQLYNYYLGDYPTSGDGYMSYTSSATANTDETKSQTIIVNPTHFRNATGYWKMKVKGVKATETQFDFKADWIELKPTHYSEYTVSIEFLFSGMTTNTPTQLNFTVVSEYNITSVNVTIQVWNYSSSAYVTSGEGYLTYTSTGTNVTKVLSINTNPQFYTSSGYAKIKVTGVNSTTTEFQQKINQIKLIYKYDASPTYDYVLKVVNQVADNWKVNLKVYNSLNIGRISSAKISLHNGTTSDQIIISNGVVTQSEGAPYDLAGSTTLYISIGSLQATTSDTSCLYVYLKIQVPNTSTYNLLIIAFEIT